MATSCIIQCKDNGVKIHKDIDSTVEVILPLICKAYDKYLTLSGAGEHYHPELFMSHLVSLMLQDDPYIYISTKTLKSSAADIIYKVDLQKETVRTFTRSEKGNYFLADRYVLGYFS